MVAIICVSVRGNRGSRKTSLDREASLEAGGREVAIQRRHARACRPKLLRDQDGGHLTAHPRSPPSLLRCHACGAPNVLAAERHRELVADRSPQGAGLGDLQVVRIARTCLADETWLR